MRLETLTSSIIRNIKNRNGYELSKQYSLEDSHINDSTLIKFIPADVKMSDQFSVWREMLISHLKILSFIRQNNIKSALESQCQIIQLVLELFKQIEDDNWFLPVVYRIAVDTRKLICSEDCKTVSQITNQNSDFVSNSTVASVNYLQKLFNECNCDKGTAIESSKRLGMMAICNQLFKIYFFINQFNLCKPLIVAIENLNIMEKFSISHRVTYSYYVGRKCMFDDNFQKANECLTFAFENCHKDYVKNKRMILIYLIPVKMLLGSFANENVLLKYNLPEFSGIMTSMRNGDLKLLESELSRHKSFFISSGIYLILEKLKYIAYRNLFKIVCKIIGNHLLPISAFCDALRFVGISDIDIDETGCILANLIYENKIKGYLAYQQQKLVISKTNPFPPINQTSLTNTR